MRARIGAFTLAAAMVAALALAGGPAGATSAYEMYGQGTLETKAGSNGMGACPGALAPGCSDTGSDEWQFSDITVVGQGSLDGNTVASMYDCGGAKSSVTTTGHTANFTLNWVFNCQKDNSVVTGVGPNFIRGSFTSIQGGVPVFNGTFRACTTSSSTSCGPSQQSTCSGGFVPTDFNGNSISEVEFAGECTSAVA